MNEYRERKREDEKKEKEGKKGQMKRVKGIAKLNFINHLYTQYIYCIYNFPFFLSPFMPACLRYIVNLITLSNTTFSSISYNLSLNLTWPFCLTSLKPTPILPLPTRCVYCLWTKMSVCQFLHLCLKYLSYFFLSVYECGSYSVAQYIRLLQINIAHF